MPAGRRKTIEQASDQEIRALLIAGTLICLVIVVVSFYAAHQPAWFLWIGRCFALAWMVSAWYRGLRELRKRRRKDWVGEAPGSRLEAGCEMNEQINGAGDKSDDKQRQPRSPLTVFKWVAVGTVGVLVALVVVAKVAKFRSVRDMICCDCNLKQIGLSFRIFANDHLDRYPMNFSTNQGGTMEYMGAGQVFRHFLAISNELDTPLVLTCPADTRRPVAGVLRSLNPVTNFTKLSDSNLSYLISLDTTDGQPNTILSGDRNWLVNGVPVGTGMVAITTNSAVAWSATFHKCGGNIALGDGSVQSGGSARLQEQVRYSDVATNRLLFP